MSKQILVLGSLNIDFSVELERIPIQGETLEAESMAMLPGGKGANQAYAAASLGGEVKMLGLLGQDAFADMLLESLGKVGVDTSSVGRVRGKNSGMAIVAVDQQGRNSIMVIPGSNAAVSEDFVRQNKHLISDCGLLLLQNEIPEASVFSAIRLGKRYRKTIFYNPAPARGPVPDAVLDGLDFLLPNESELCALAGREIRDSLSEDEAEEMARGLMAKGVKNIIVTLGSKGALLLNGEGRRLFPAEKAEAVDTTAAGDTFIGALACALGEGQTLDEAIRFANRAAAITVTRKGAQQAIPSRRELNEAFSSSL